MAHDQILSVCSGIGGLDLGLSAGLRAVGRSPRTVCMVEREAFTGAVLAQKMREGWLDDCPLWLGDLRDLPLDELPAIDWITGGYPCQPWSAAGKRLGEADPRHLWPVILDTIRTLRPRGVFFENVGGHLSLGLDRVLQDLEGCGFRSAFGLFTAEEVGAPHRRERVFILGVADAQDADRRIRVGGEKEGTRENSERRRRSPVGGPELADGEREGLEGDLPNPDEEGWEDAGRPSPRCGEHRRAWPRRPGQEQHEEEPPRTTEPGLGGSADGLPDRVDRLRALGNAVVPAQAARAFVTLWEEVTRC